MWNKREVTYEETSKVKEALISALVNEYELFKMVNDENVETMVFQVQQNCLQTQISRNGILIWTESQETHKKSSKN